MALDVNMHNPTWFSRFHDLHFSGIELGAKEEKGMSIYFSQHAGYDNHEEMVEQLCEVLKMQGMEERE